MAGTNNPWRQRMGDTVAAEFADIPDLEQFTRVVVRLLLAALLGGILGFEREKSGKAAGVRTHMLVAMGAALFVLVPLQAGIWLTAAVGIAAGVGRETTAVLALAILSLEGPMRRPMDKRGKP